MVMVCDHSRRPIHNVFIWNDKGKTGRDEDQALDYRRCNCILDSVSLLFYFKLVDIIITPNRILNVRPKLPKPSCGILWDRLSDDQNKSIAILQKLKPLS